MSGLLSLSRLIDAISLGLGKLIGWLILAATVISAVNAVLRKAFNVGSNSALEIQWYLFAAVFMLGVGYVMLKNDHVRIDFISSRFSKRTNAIIDIVGMVVFTIPLAWIMIDLAWPYFMRAYDSGEMSQNAGGLIRWPVIALIPLGFGVLLMQTLSELIKRIGFLTGHRDQPFSVEHDKTNEEILAEELLAEVEAAAQAQAQAARELAARKN
jgi:TRAP-type mannitol/chloroaromatic compound transport system permease small subunit